MKWIEKNAERVNVRRRLLILIGIFAVGLAAVAATGIADLRADMLAEKEQQTRRLVEVARAVAAEHARLVAAGELSEDAAKARALAIIEALRYDGDQYFWINSVDGEMLMHPTVPRLVGTDLRDVVDARGDRIFADMIEVVRDQGGGAYSYYWPPNDDAQRKISYVIGFEDWGWVIGSGIFVTDMFNAYVRQALGLSAIAGVVLAVTAGISIIIAGTIAKPLAAITTAMGELARGHNAIAIPGTERTDEIRSMAEALVVFRDNAVERDTLDVAQKARATRIDDAIGRFDGEVGAALGAVDAATGQLDGSADTMVSAAGQASSNVQAMAAAAEEMSASVAEISHQTGTSRSVANEAVKAVETASRVVSELNETAQQITGIIDLISDIADQTNLLALNATIEAARAGDAGRGFAVVAHEVKTLAGRTGQATADITEKIGAISQGSDQAVQMIGEVNHVMARLDEIATAIAGAIDEQSATTQSIAQNAQDAAQGTEHVVETIRGASTPGAPGGQVSMVAASRALGDQSGRLKERIRAFFEEIRAA